MADKNYEIIKEIAVLSENSTGWRMELNLVKWFGNEAKYDIRDWSPDHTRCGKGITLSDDELNNLVAGIRDGKIKDIRERVREVNGTEDFNTN